MKKWLLIIFVTFGLVGCGSFSNSGGTFADGDPIVIHDTIDGLTFHVEIEKDTFSKGEEIHIKAEVKNERDTPITYVVGSSSCPTPIQFHVSQDSNYPLLEKGFREIACTEDYRYTTLKPQETIKREVILVQEVMEVNGTFGPAPRGTYDVFITVKELNKEPISVRTTISLVE